MVNFQIDWNGVVILATVLLTLFFAIGVWFIPAMLINFGYYTLANIVFWIMITVIAIVGIVPIITE